MFREAIAGSIFSILDIDTSKRSVAKRPSDLLQKQRSPRSRFGQVRKELEREQDAELGSLQAELERGSSISDSERPSRTGWAAES